MHVYTQYTCIYTHSTVSSQLLYSRVQKLSGIQVAGASLGSASSGPQSVMGSKQLAMPTRLGLPNLRSSNLYKAIVFPRWLSGQESASQWRKCRFNSWVRKILWRKWQPTPEFLPGKLHGQKNLAGSMGSQRVGYNWACARARTHTHTPTHTHTTSLLKAYVTSLRGLTQVIHIHKKKYLLTSATLLGLKHNSELQSYICIFTKRGTCSSPLPPNSVV